MRVLSVVVNHAETESALRAAASGSGGRWVRTRTRNELISHLGDARGLDGVHEVGGRDPHVAQCAERVGVLEGVVVLAEHVALVMEYTVCMAKALPARRRLMAGKHALHAVCANSKGCNRSERLDDLGLQL